MNSSFKPSLPMVKASKPTLLERVRSKLGSRKTHEQEKQPTSEGPGEVRAASASAHNPADPEQAEQVANAVESHGGLHNSANEEHEPSQPSVTEKPASTSPPTAAPTTASAVEESSATLMPETLAAKVQLILKQTIFYTKWNLLLVSVPVGIAAQFAGLNPGAVFGLNAVAIIPLAGLLTHATEAVALTLGDTVGALLNVTFGNAVELIIFIIALSKNQIRIVQASLVGSILANLLLILGMCFIGGGLKFREQIYNSTVTQMSVCLLTLSVASILIPTIFHFSFSSDSTSQADAAVIQLSRGTSVILLVIYILYILFQLKSHAYLYSATPQHVIDEESHPGLLTELLNSSSTSDSSSDDSDSDATSGSHTTAKRIKRALRRRGRRKSSASSKYTPSLPSAVRTPSNGAVSSITTPTGNGEMHRLGAIASGDEADNDETPTHFGGFDSQVYRRDFGSPTGELQIADRAGKKKSKKQRKKTRKQKEKSPKQEKPALEEGQAQPSVSPRAKPAQETVNLSDTAARRPFNLRTLSVRPTIPKVLSSTVFSAANPTRAAVAPSVPAVPRAPYGLRRTSSLPDRLNRSTSTPSRAQLLHRWTTNPTSEAIEENNKEQEKPEMSRPTAIALLLISTALVALCAEFLVGSINYMVSNTDVGEVFIGLILLPIVGNAAEHVTAVTFAYKNKMDLAIGVAIGSSIQIALFVTPVVVLLGWILDRDMSLYFSLFELATAFVASLLVSFLVLDGRSNYLEGALLFALYMIIAVAAFLYPDTSQQSSLGGVGGN